MKLKLILSHFLLLFLVVYSCFAQEIRTKVWLDTSKLEIGDQALFNLQIETNFGTRLVFPTLKDTLGKLEIISPQKIDTHKFDSGIKYTLRCRVTSFDSGLYTIPPLKILYQEQNENTWDTTFTDSLQIYFSSIEIDTTADFKDIKGIIEVPITIWDYLPYIIGFFIALGVGVIIFFVYKKIKKERLPEELKVPPHEWALSQLKKLESEKLWQRGEIKEYHSRLSEILRRYMELQFDFPALEMVSREIIEYLRANELVNSNLLNQLNRAFEVSDLVKFAKFVPLPDEHTFCMKVAIEFIENTIRNEDSTKVEQEQTKL
ncbi:MAG: hypothetical protein N2517_06810 [Ignavibacteria bacterium]|nr:hypothetical protein [Ignavibacteria bacterium]